jgi:hypothetical protein
MEARARWSLARRTQPYAMHVKPLHDQKLGVWVAISRGRIVSSLFFEETENSKRYCSMPHDFIGLLEED